MAIYSARTLTKSAFAVLLVAGLSVLSAAAQVQNPIQAAKDAYNKAKQQQQQPQQSIDPRIRVYISDQTIFTVENSDRYPPDLEALTKGVDVLPFATGSLGGRGNLNVNATDVGSEQLTAKKKVYLRAIPIDPVTGKAEWDFRSCYQTADENSWDNINVFDVHSKSTATALNGEKYSDW